MSQETIKKYIGVAADSLAEAYQKIRGMKEEEEPPLGAQDRVGGGRKTPSAAAVAGIPMGTILLFGALWFLAKRKRR